MSAVRKAIVAALAAGCLTACARHANVASPPTTSAGPNSPQRTAALNGRTFRAVLQPQGGGTVTGAASIAPGQQMGTTVVTLDITGGTPGATYAWHIHEGACGSQGGILGDPSQYQPVQIGQDGRGRATSTVNVPPPSGGSYHVNVHAPDMQSLVACGNLEEAGA